jgi:tetratricopeptide repeat protein
MFGSWWNAPRVGGLCVLLVVTSLPMGTPAFAEEAGDSAAADAAARVEQLIARGIQSRDAGQDAEALELFRRANALRPENPRVLAHLGATYHALGRWVSAHVYLTQALQNRDDPYIQRHRAELEDALATVGDHIGFLEIYGAPEGAEALLNGQLTATLPMTAPVPITVGSYVLEVRLAGHYTLGRPITIAKRVLTREEVELAPHATAPTAVASTAQLAATPGEPLERDEATSGGGSNWWPWALGGVSVAAAATSIVAWEQRNHYAKRWNDDEACLGVGVSRQERCGDERERGQRAETVMWVSGVASGLFAGGAVLAVILSPSKKQEPDAAVQCVPALGGAACFGTF